MTSAKKIRRTAVVNHRLALDCGDQPHSQAFSSQFTREKPWERGYLVVGVQTQYRRGYS